MKKLLLGLAFLFLFSLSFLPAHCQEVTDRVPVEVDASAEAGIKSMGWKQISGPGSPVIVEPGSPSTLITGFVVPGDYVFEFQITDLVDRSATTQIKIKVLPAWAGPRAKAKVVEYIIRAKI